MEDKNYLATYSDIIFQFGNEAVPDLAEVAVDQLFGEGVLKDIPVIGSVLKVGRLVQGIYNVFTTKHILVFAQQFNEGEITQEKIKEHFDNLNAHPKKKIQEMETLLQNATKHRKYIQDKILANFYGLYCDPDVEFGWSEFEMICMITEGLYPYDLVELEHINELKKYTEQNYDRYALGRLKSLGLVNYFDDMEVSNRNDASAEYYYASITEWGKSYIEYGLRGISIYSEIDGERRIL